MNCIICGRPEPEMSPKQHACSFARKMERKRNGELSRRDDINEIYICFHHGLTRDERYNLKYEYYIREAKK